MEIDVLNPPLFGFYTKSLDCGGIFIRGSQFVSDRILTESCQQLNRMLKHQEAARQNLRHHGVELHIIAGNETLFSLPEHQLPDRSTAPQANTDIYGICPEITPNGHDALDQCTRQLAISILLYGFDNEIRKRVQEQFASSKARGLLKPDAINAQAYWSQLSVSYFDAQNTKQGAIGSNRSDPASLAFAKRIYDGLERPKTVEAIRARSVSTLALSKTNSMPASVQFVNNSSKSFQLLWMDTDGHLHPMADLRPYNRILKDTTLDQVWVIQDRRGAEIDRILIENYLSEYIVAD